jgi:hypothetical protein
MLLTPLPLTGHMDSLMYRPGPLAVDWDELQISVHFYDSSCISIYPVKDNGLRQPVYVHGLLAVYRQLAFLSHMRLLNGANFLRIDVLQVSVGVLTFVKLYSYTYTY